MRRSLLWKARKPPTQPASIFPDHVCTTSPFGSANADKADWSPLHGRTVVIWPDNDGPGAKYAADVARLVPGAKVVPVPASFPDKWDLADELPEGVTFEVLCGLLLLAEVPKAKAQAKAKKPSKDDLRKSAEEAKRERDGIIAKIRGLISKTVANGATEAEADSAFNKARRAYGGAQHSRGRVARAGGRARTYL